ncbi:MAG TPA: AbrB/MazE/SpoVT family DNA-binding domain-containing protein [Steroidobacteraceae bacterium]|nr:AbrB/MazE/SpoVT family DNA-binding domain-containing protein [Steroidobacteraceae bacterium]
MSARAQLTVQAWGNSLAVRIPARIAKASRLALGQPVALEVADGVVIVRPEGKPKLTLAQKLKAYNPDIHGGEAMTTNRVGAEVM